MEEQVKVKVDHLTKKFDQLLVLDEAIRGGGYEKHCNKTCYL